MSAAKPRKLNKRTTADEALQGAIDVKGKVAVVTGGNAGIGFQTCRSLARAGATVFLCARSEARGREAIDAIRKEPGGEGADVRLVRLDLADLASVRRAAEQLMKELATLAAPAAAAATAAATAPGADAASQAQAQGASGGGGGGGAALHMLILNAGVVASPMPHTAQGLEPQTGINHIAHFYFTQLLLPALTGHGGPARVVVVASKAHAAFGDDVLDADDLNWERRTAAGKYGMWAAYGQSKLCNVLFAVQLADRLKDTPVRVFSLHPGVIFTSLESNLPVLLRAAMRVLLWPMSKSVKQGAATSVYAATAPELEPAHLSGTYLDDCGPGKASAAGRDKDLARRVWAASEQLLAKALASGAGSDADAAGGAAASATATVAAH
ncbi:hypothetical protein HXX76_006502 [Chlamydomonas incerta]|uniref:Uncharacterized protein n=1 Tax=Chlamydomonas incerta TaxID=51695 RepID=A0A835TE29_CHLIN|nr:hypothetical protein HXX76_006502 [Chlamydomonas incerta]|eukprot:KAG2436190.1 hypothetical protein HXX76_006502 [Chlamydomonas incerta]